MKNKKNMRKFIGLLLVLPLAIAGYLVFVPAPIDPVVFDPPPPAPQSPPNDSLKRLEILDLDGRVGPEDVAVNSRGEVFAAMENGDILRIAADGRTEVFLNTGGRPLGLVFDPGENLIVADPYRGLLKVTPDAAVEVLVPARGAKKYAEGTGDTLCYANNVDVGPGGVLYFTDSTARFCPPAYGGTFEASLLDIFEHRKTGRFLSFDSATKELRVLIDGIQFANGVAVSPDGRHALIVETGDCRVLRYHLQGARRGQVDVIMEGLAGYPDNLTRGLEGRYWIGFTKPRSKILERLAGSPFWRSLIARLPRSLFPIPQPFGHIVAIDRDGRVLARHQDADPVYPDTTGATETPRGLYVHSLHARGLGWLPHKKSNRSEEN